MSFRINWHSKKIPTVAETVENPRVEIFKKERTCTDLFFLIFMILFYLILIILLVYCAMKGDINQIIRGYDNCGNVCGQKNSKEINVTFSCKGVDMTAKKYLLMNDSTELGFHIFDLVTNSGKARKQCVSHCNKNDGFSQKLNRCIRKDAVQIGRNAKQSIDELLKNIAMRNFEIICLCIISVVLSISMLILYRYFIGFFVGFILLGIIALSSGITAYLWIMWSAEKNNVYLYSGIVVTIISVIIIIIIIFLRKRIALMVQLFKEASKAVASMPTLILFPIVTFLIISVFIVLWLSSLLVIGSAGELAINTGTGNIYYRNTGTMVYTLWHNILGIFWLIFFVNGCQDMAIAGAVAVWFFTINKNQLQSPISTSLNNLFKYHLGSVAVGSFCIAVLQTIRVFLLFCRMLMRQFNASNRACKYLITTFECCLAVIQKILNYWSKNAYIVTAINGCSFYTAGQRAFAILLSNITTVAAINSIGSFILFLGKVIIVLITVLIGYFWLRNKDDSNAIGPLILVGILSFIIAHIFLEVYEMVIDSLFICFCEDMELNDGDTKPYYMSKDLMQFVENSKKFDRIKKSNSVSSND